MRPRKGRTEMEMRSNGPQNPKDVPLGCENAFHDEWIVMVISAIIASATHDQ